MQFTDGGKYRLPTGEKVTARLIDGKFIFEFKRNYRAPLSLGEDGALYLRGESSGFRADSLTVDNSED